MKNNSNPKNSQIYYQINLSKFLLFAHYDYEKYLVLNKNIAITLGKRNMGTLE